MSRYDDLNKVWDDRAFKGYARVTDRPGHWLAIGAIAFVLLIGAVVVGGWEVGWWFKNQNINRESHALRSSYQNQQTLREQVTQNIGNVLAISSQVAGTKGAEKVALRQQRAAVVGIVCQSADQVTGDPLPADQIQFVKANCDAGNISPSSPYGGN